MRKRSKWILGIVVALVLLLFFHPYVELFIGGSWVRWTLRNDENVYLVPEEYTLDPVRGEAGWLYTFQELTFRAPFAERGEKFRDAETVLPLRWGEKQLVVFEEQPSADSFLKDIESGEAEKLKEFLGEDAFSSNYAFYSKMLRSTPKDITLFPPGKETLTYSILTILKSVAVLDAEKVYAFSSSGARGYKFLDTTSDGEPRTRVEVFDMRDLQYLFLFVNFSQGEVDFVLNSIK